jgi:hypothetical protein
MPGLSRLAPLCPGFYYLLENFVALTGGVGSQGFYLLGE